MILISLKIFLHLRFIATSFNNRLQLDDNVYDPNFFSARSKITVGNYESNEGFCGNMFMINLHDLQMLFMI